MQQSLLLKESLLKPDRQRDEHRQVVGCDRKEGPPQHNVCPFPGDVTFVKNGTIIHVHLTEHLKLVKGTTTSAETYKN